ncbi:MAG: hypothetical protein H7Y62_12590 [Hyphomicrobium sp.]|nr:hypothetical protein [Hyphomicrobium sp.]
MVTADVTAFKVETTIRHGDIVRADVYLPEDRAGPFPIPLGGSHCQKALCHLPAGPFPFIEYGPMQLCLDEGVSTS